MSQNQQVKFDHIDNVRKELDAKIESKVSEKMFFWIVGGLTSIALVAILYCCNQINTLIKQVTIIETKMQ